MKGQDLFDARVFHSAETTTIFYQFIATLRQKINDEVEEASATHKFIRTLRDGGRLMRCYTQNIDGLEAREGLCMDLKAGKGNKRRFMKKNYETPRPTTTKGTDFESGCEVVQLHGELSNLRCRVCATEQDWSDSATEIFLEGAAPKCETCEEKSDIRQATGKRGLAVGELRPNIVLYGEEHPQNSLLIPLIAFDQASNPDLLIIMGTSLKVHGLQKVVRDFAKVVHNQKNGRVVFVNRTRPSESQWDGIIDDYIAMDCDDWISDLKKRRGDLWYRQGELSLKVTKPAAGQKRKKSSTDEPEQENAPTTKKTKITVNVPPRKALQDPSIPKDTPSKGRTKRPSQQTPKSRTGTGWKTRDSVTRAASKLLSPLIQQQRPTPSPFRNHFRPLARIHADNDEHFIPGSPLSPAFSALTSTTPTPTTISSRFAKNESMEMTIATPTPRQNMRSSGLRKSLLSRSEESENILTPGNRSVVDSAQEIPESDGEQDGHEVDEETEERLHPSSAVKKLSFVSVDTADEGERPLYPSSYLLRFTSLFARA